MAIFEKFSYKYGLTKLTEEQERIFVSKYGPIEKLEYGPATNATNATNVAAANANVIYLDEYRQKRAR